MSCEGEGERDFLFKWLWGPDDQIRKIETPCPEYPGQWPEYPGVTILPPKRNLVPRFNGCAKLRKMELGEYLDTFVTIPDI